MLHLQSVAEQHVQPHQLARHQFGGVWTLTKLQALEKYLQAFTRALNNKFTLHYIDAFAGTGRCDVVGRDGILVTRGSATIALGVNPPFQTYTFIERSRKRCTALKNLAAAYPDANVEIIKGDANGELLRICRETNWRSARGVVLLDPAGLSVDWPTLQAIAETRALDVWYLFPLSGVTRQAARDARRVEPLKEASITRILGTDEWRRDWYSQPSTIDMFDDAQREERHVEQDHILRFATKRFKGLFPGVVGPKELRLELGGSERATLYALYFFCSNPSATAQDVACRIARDVLKSL